MRTALFGLLHTTKIASLLFPFSGGNYFDKSQRMLLDRERERSRVCFASCVLKAAMEFELSSLPSGYWSTLGW